MMQLMKLALLPLALAALALAQGGGVVFGTIASRTTHAPAGGIQVELYRGGDASPAYIVQTDAAGAYRIAGISDGEYRLSFRTREFQDRTIAKPLRISANAGPLRLDVELVPLGRISGRVLDAEGHPMPQIGIQMRRLHGGGSSMSGTDENGTFSIKSLAAGAYVLAAQPDLRTGGGSVTGRKLPVIPDTDGPAAWAPTFYPDVTEQSQAQPIVIRAGSELSGFDIRVRSVPVRRVRGTLLDDAGKPLPRIVVELMPEDAYYRSPLQVTSDAKGNFELPAVRAGVWHLVANANALRAATRLTVGKEDIQDLQVPMAHFFALRGSVDREDRRDAQGKRPVSAVQLIPAAGFAQQVESHDQNGNFRFAEVHPGRYEISPAPMKPGFYIDSVKLGELEVLGKVVDLVDGSLPIRVTYKSNGGRVRGTVENGEGSTIALIPQDSAFLNWHFIETVACGAAGTFDIGAIRPGDYYAFAFDEIVDSWALQDQTFLTTVLGRAERVHIGAGENSLATTEGHALARMIASRIDLGGHACVIFF